MKETKNDRTPHLNLGVFLTYQAVIQELERRGRLPEGPPNLDRMKKAMDLTGFYGWPFWKKFGDRPDRVIVVAGTNGKGSVCATLETLLHEAGERTGFYSSPHLENYTERIRVAGVEVSQDLFARAYTQIAPQVSAKASALPLTHFEMLTLMALWVFCSGEASPVVDRLILEVGLGGLWDATNAVPHGIAVITTLGLDHQNLLGGSLEEIARNKLGIVPPHGKVIHARFPSEVLAAVEETRSKEKCILIEAPTMDFKVTPSEAPPQGSREPEFRLRSIWGESKINLPGARGAENTNLALKVFETLGFDPSLYLDCLTKVNWPGRMERVTSSATGAPVYLSGDHNPQGVRSLKDLLQYFDYETIHIIVGIGTEKDSDSMLKLLFQVPRSKIYLTQTPFRRRSDYGSWQTKAAGFDNDPRNIYDEVTQNAKPGDLIVVTGSLYLVGALRREIRLATLSGEAMLEARPKDERSRRVKKGT